MHSLPPILAAASGAEIVIVLVILVIGWISSAVDKWKKARAAQGVTPPPPTIQQVQQLAPVATNKLRVEQQQKQRQLVAAHVELAQIAKKQLAKRSKPGKQPAVRNASVSTPAATLAQAMSPPPVVTTATPFAPARPIAPRAISATAVHDWLTPATLRKQFLLTEIFNPPLALREPR